MQPRTAEDALLPAVEDPEHEVPAEVEVATEPAEESNPLLEGLRLAVRPLHPRAQMIEARVDRLLELRRVAWLPAAEDGSLGDDPVRRVDQDASTRRAASTMRATEGMYASSICQYGYGTS